MSLSGSCSSCSRSSSPCKLRRTSPLDPISELTLACSGTSWVVTWIILLPVDAVGSRGTHNGLERFTFGNVGESEQPRYAAHLILAWFLTFWVLYLIKREYARFIVLRQDFLMSKEHMRLAQSRTVLVTGVPKEYLNQDAMHRFCSVLPGGAKRVWFAR